MKYTNKSKNELSSFLTKIESLIQKERKVIISDIKKVQEFLMEEEGNCEIIGELNIMANSEYRREADGTNITLIERLSLNNKGFTINSIYNEGIYGEYYTNNEMRIDEDEDEKFLSNYLNDSYSAIERILVENEGFIEIETNRFGIKKIRKKNSAMA